MNQLFETVTSKTKNLKNVPFQKSLCQTFEVLKGRGHSRIKLQKTDSSK